MFRGTAAWTKVDIYCFYMMINLLLPSSEVKPCIWLSQTLPSPVDLYFSSSPWLLPAMRRGRGGGRIGLRKVETDVSAPPLHPPSCPTHTLRSSPCCIPNQIVTCGLVLQPSSISSMFPVHMCCKKQKFPQLFKGSSGGQGGNLGVEVRVGVAGTSVESESQLSCLLCV